MTPLPKTYWSIPRWYRDPLEVNFVVTKEISLLVSGLQRDDPFAAQASRLLMMSRSPEAAVA